jgi:hypothetical protein
VTATDCRSDLPDQILLDFFDGLGEMASGKETIRFLKRQNETKMVLSESGRYFLPGSYLRVIFTLEDLKKAVDELEVAPYERLGLARKIYDESTKIFAILIKNGEEDWIVQFRNNNMLDARLPLDEDSAERIAPGFGTSFAREYQWQFLPFQFRRDMRDHVRIIESKEILPFIGKSKLVASGGFGDIYKMNIFPSQQEFVSSEVT